jgi:hypothetical protein
MSERQSESGKDCEALEEFLRGLTPAALPDGLRRDLFARLGETPRRSLFERWWRAAAAVLVAAGTLAFWWAGSGGESNRGTAAPFLAGLSPVEEDPDAGTAGGVVETTDVVGLQDAGTTPTQSGAYRIVLVTFVHRMWDAAEGAPEGKVLSESTSQSYLAVPLEIF